MLQTSGILHYSGNLKNPCRKHHVHIITDKQFLMHMIPHHQVAVDMSKKVLKYTRDPNIIYIARNIIFKQSDEILFMESMLLSSIPNMSSSDQRIVEIIPNQFTVWYNKESRADKFKCMLHHFSPNIHRPNNLLTDKAYLEQMIYHHDVAVDMANKVTRYSSNPSMVTFGYEIIKNQRYEIWLMRSYLKKSQQQCSKIL